MIGRRVFVYAQDVERVVRVDKATTETQKKRGVRDWFYALDFNERCPNVDYLLQFLQQVPYSRGAPECLAKPRDQNARSSR